MTKTTSPDACCPAILENTLDAAGAENMSGILKALADPIRLRLLNVIAGAEGGEACACDFPALLEKSQPTVSHHLSQLVKAGILIREQRGKWAWFRINRHRVDSLCRAFGGPRCC